MAVTSKFPGGIMEEAALAKVKKKKSSREKKHFSTLPRDVSGMILEEEGKGEIRKEKKGKEGKLDKSPSRLSRRRANSNAVKAVNPSISINAVPSITNSTGEISRFRKKKSPRRSISPRSPEKMNYTVSGVVTVSTDSPRIESPATKKKNKLRYFSLPKVYKNKKPLTKDIFHGTTISDLVVDDNEIPIIIRQCVDYLVTNDAHCLSGIFRKSGRHKLIEEYKKSYSCPLAEANLEDCKDPHTIADLLKQFLSSLSEPVIPHKDYDRFLQNFNHYKEDKEKIGVLTNLVSTLPECNRSVLLYLMRFLTRVDRNSEVNLMTYKNLGLIFGPIILRPENYSFENLQDLTNGEIVGFMVHHYRQIFQR